MGNIGPVGSRGVTRPVSNPAEDVAEARPAASVTPGSASVPTDQQVALQQDGFEPPGAPPPVDLTGTEGPRPLGQRERALEVTRQSPPGSVGAAIRPLLSGAMQTLGAVGYGMGAAPSAAALAVPGMAATQPGLLERIGENGRAGQAAGREVAAGQVGDFYESQRELLNRPATISNIMEFAQRETDFFRQQPLSVSAPASVMSASTRASLIMTSAVAQRIIP
ncbi:hypothetical protein [Corallococcus terminator]|uniref:hypothetical protein n=1 Tax=Corallococcus terminator TaxID=2316733 RepID=UPI0011C43D8F|nr:hypothetical protein [Corallococcus terminator]